jgi:glycosyltransferase involved in cell wall biosynthesis
MRVLFVSTGNYYKYYNDNISPHVRLPGEALKENAVELDYFLINGKGILGYLKNIPKLRRLLKHRSYDIIHAHYGYSGIVGALSRRREKLIISFMGSDVLKVIDRKGRNILLGKFFALINQTFSHYIYDFRIAKSMEMKKRLKNIRNLAVIPNGVRFDVFYPVTKKAARQQLGIKESVKIILFVADPDMIIKNYSLARRAYESLQLENSELKIVFGQSHEKLNLYYNASDLLLLTSFQEGSPNVIKEAMACNCPIVATDVGDIKEILSNTEGCYICSFDVANVADKIKRAILFNKRTNGREGISHLDSNKVAEKMISIYRKMLE